MEMPSVRTSLRDPANEVTYHVDAYRQLTRQELLMAVAMYQRQVKKKPKRGTAVTIKSLIGLGE
ncbi:hypothetical protein [Caldimonas tepidiphila]|uniref:hypothetical protein n=1 Tax=Caldimonas tepidiphila TaxID=2315841 RepID=UPI000E5A3D1B|nr:hypothetical protein [Caldimonas tepidiphila]